MGWFLCQATCLKISFSHIVTSITHFGSHRHQISGCELKLQIWSFCCAQRPWQEIIQTTGPDVATSLPCSLGICLYATNGGSFPNIGRPQTREKGSHLPLRTTKLCNLRNSHDSITSPSVNQIRDSLLGTKDAVMLSPPRNARNVTGPHLVGVA